MGATIIGTKDGNSYKEGKTMEKCFMYIES